MYIGVVITTCTIANLQLLVTNMDAALTNFQHKLELMKWYMRYRKLPSCLQNRIVSFYDYQWDLLKGSNEEEVSTLCCVFIFCAVSKRHMKHFSKS